MQKNPVQVAVMVGGGLMLGSMVIGPVIAALSLAGFVAAASAFSGLAFGAIFLSVGVAMSFSMFSLFGAMALPLLAPLFTFAAVFVALRAVLPKQSSNDTSKQQMETPAEARAQTEAEREAAEKLKKKVEEEMRRKEVEDELRAFDTLLESRTKYSDLDKRS